MSTLVLFAVVSQVASPELFTWSDGARRLTAPVSATLVAEPSPSPEGERALKALAPEATVALATPSMRLWRVRDSAAVRAALPGWRPVLIDGARLKVPLSVGCDTAANGGPCAANFWYPAVRK